MDFSQYIPWIISLGGFIVALITLSRNGRKDRRNEYIEEANKIDLIKESLTKANVKLDTICTTMTETRTDIKVMHESLNAMENRVSIVENEMKAMWVRLDELKTKIGRYHEGE